MRLNNFVYTGLLCGIIGGVVGWFIARVLSGGSLSPSDQFQIFLSILAILGLVGVGAYKLAEFLLQQRVRDTITSEVTKASESAKEEYAIVQIQLYTQIAGLWGKLYESSEDAGQSDPSYLSSALDAARRARRIADADLKSVNETKHLWSILSAYNSLCMVYAMDSKKTAEVTVWSEVHRIANYLLENADNVPTVKAYYEETYACVKARLPLNGEVDIQNAREIWCALLQRPDLPGDFKDSIRRRLKRWQIQL